MGVGGSADQRSCQERCYYKYSMKSDKRNESIPVRLTAFFMKCVGLWTAKGVFELRLRRFALTYTIFMSVYSYYTEGRDLIYTWSTGDFVEITYVVSNIFTIVMVSYKLAIIVAHKEEFLYLITYAQKHFWHSNYDSQERKIVLESARTCTIFICCFTFFAQCTVCCYMLNPILANMGKNESERILPFNIYVNLPVAYSPYFEIAFVSQTLCLYHVGICFFCFDNCLCLFCLYTAAQFRILQHRLSRACHTESAHGQLEYETSDSPNDNYDALKDCIRMHQDLIQFCERLQAVFSKIALGEVVLFSFLICFTGYQVLLAVAPPSRRLLFIFHNLGDFSQLMMFTYSCGYLQYQSSLIPNAAYSSPWAALPMDKTGTNLRKDVMIMIARSQKYCGLSACGFFVVTLETYTAVLSTAASYLTLLKRSGAGIK